MAGLGRLVHAASSTNTDNPATHPTQTLIHGHHKTLLTKRGNR